MPYSNNPGTRATYEDTGALLVNNISTQPVVFVLGAAEKGDSYRRYNVTAVSDAEAEFGSASPVMRTVHEAMKQSADNITMMRIGGQPGSWTITDDNGKSIKLITNNTGDDVLDRYALQITSNADFTNRFVVYDLVDRNYVYDSNDIFTLDTGDIYIDDTGYPYGVLLNDAEANPSLWISLVDVVPGDITGTTLDASSPVAINGTDGVNDSLIEKYAALNIGYFHLDYKASDLLVPTDVYLDSENIVDVPDLEIAKSGLAPASATDYGLFWAGPRSAGSDGDMLGYVWQYVYEGHVYTAFADQVDAFSLVGATAASVSHDGLVITSVVEGKGGNACSLTVIDDASGDQCLLTYNDQTGGYDFVLVMDIAGTAPDSAAAAVIVQAAIDNYVAPDGTSPYRILPADIFAAVAGDATPLTATAKTQFTGGTGAHTIFLDPNLRRAVPAEVTDAWNNATDAQLRECNFAHQLAEASYRSSVEWHATLGIIGVQEPQRNDGISPTSRAYVPMSEWAGSLPTYGDNGTDKFISSVANNGRGLLGNKFLAGQYGYRGGQLVKEPGTSGYAYGGFIRTVGSALPNGEEWPYGVNDADEAIEDSGRPLDIGKHLIITHEWPLLSTGYDGGSTYYGTMAGTLAGKLAVTPGVQEPIGQFGRLVNVNDPTDLHSTQRSQLAGLRYCGLIENDQFGLVINSIATAAHPTSDYGQFSTIRAANRLIQGCRSRALRYIGKQFTPRTLMSLDSDIEQYLVEEGKNGIHNGARHTMNYTPSERILGRLNIELRFVPPFTLRWITVRTSVAPDESAL